MTDITKTKFKELCLQLKERKISCEEIMRQTLANIERYNPILGSYLSLQEEDSLLSQAAEAYKR